MLTNLVDSADIGMIQCRRGAGLTQEALVGLLVLGDVIGQELEGDEAMQLGVLGFIHYAHAAAAQLFEDAVMRNGLA